MIVPALPIHPFPARMASEIALGECMNLSPGAKVLDPMVGSGTVIRTACEHGLNGIGYDLDPLAVLMTRVWTTPIDAHELRDTAEKIVVTAQRRRDDECLLPWIDEDDETRQFVNFWFGAEQQADLRRLSWVLAETVGPVGDALRVAMSRIIVTKDRGASLARDVSHSRPHRTRVTNDFDVFPEFVRSTRRLAKRLEDQPPPGKADVRLGDARSLVELADKSVDAVITSPPYLNALDYIRGHRLSLVWLGCRVGELRMTRAKSIGTERGLRIDDDAVVRRLCDALPNITILPPKLQRMVHRYATDMLLLGTELARVVRPGGPLTLVVGNSCLRGVFVENARVVTAAMEEAGCSLTWRTERELPASRRYLPPPGSDRSSQLEKRMRTETVLRFVRR